MYTHSTAVVAVVVLVTVTMAVVGVHPRGEGGVMVEVMGGEGWRSGNK